MNGKDLFLGLNYVNARFIEEAETVTDLKGEHRLTSFRKMLLIAAVMALLAATITACAYAIQRIRMDLVQHNAPSQTETTAASAEETSPVNVLTDCYPQFLPEGYAILCGSPLDHNSRGIEYRDEAGDSIIFTISTVSPGESVALKPPVEESAVTLTCGEALLRTNEGAQILEWYHAEAGYYASLFTDDTAADLVTVANGVDFGETIPLSVWYHKGQEWDPWYPQQLPDGYICIGISQVGSGYQSFTYTDGSNTIRYGVSTVEALTPSTIGEEEYWEEAKVNGSAAKILRNETTQRTLFWENEAEGFHAFLETMDASVNITALAESVAPGEKLEVSKSYLGPDYTIELVQEPTVYIEWQSIYPQQLPEGYVLDTVGDRAYGQQTITWKNDMGDVISYTLYFRLGQYGRQFEGSGQPETVSIHGHVGYRTGNSLIWTDEEQGFAYELHTSGDVNLMDLAESVGPGPELTFTNDKTEKALAQLGDYRITELPENMVEDGISGSPLEDGGDWYSYVRKWYYDRTNNAQIYFTYETYLTDMTTVEDTLSLFVSSDSEMPELVTVNGDPGILLQDGSAASVAWILGDAEKGISFKLYSEQFTARQLLDIAQSIQKQ